MLGYDVLSYASIANTCANGAPHISVSLCLFLFVCLGFSSFPHQEKDKQTKANLPLAFAIKQEHFAELAVDAVLRLKGSGNLEMIQIIKRSGGSLRDSFLDEGFILDKRIGVGQPKRVENAKILIANTSMDTDKIKIYGARVRVDSMDKVASIEAAEKNKMKQF